MLERFHLGGWGMYPTLVFGCLLIASVVRVMSAPSRRQVLLAITLGALVTISGLLGFLTGFIRTLDAAASASDSTLVLVGTSESLNNVALSLMILALTGVIIAVSLWRRREPIVPARGDFGEVRASEEDTRPVM